MTLDSSGLHGLDDAGNVTVKTNEQAYLRDSKRPQHERCSLHSSANDKGSNSGQVDLASRATGCKELKRKWLLEDLSHLKRTKSDEAVSGLWERNGSCTSSNSGFSCSFIGRNMKRTRDDEMLAASPLKKIR